MVLTYCFLSLLRKRKPKEEQSKAEETEELTIEMLKTLPKLEKKALLKRLKKLIKKKKI